MGSRGGGGGNNGGGVQGIPAASRKMVQSLKEIVNGVSDAEIYSALKDCNMDPNEAVNRLLTQDPFHEVKSKREKKKEFKDTTESRPRGSSTSSRGGRSGADRYSSRGGSSQFSSSESGGLHGKPRRENGTSSYTSSSAPSYGVSATNTNRSTPTYSGSIGYENKPSTYNPPDGPTTVSQPPYQSAWMGGVPGQKSMADIVKMGRPQPQPQSQPQNKPYNPVTDDYTSKSHEQHPVDDWPSIEHQTQSQTPGVQLSQPQIEQQPDNAVHLDTHHDYINEGVEEEDDEEEEDEDEGVYEDHVENTNDIYKNMEESFHPDDNNEVEEADDVAASSVTANMQQLNIQEERQINEQEDDVLDVVPSVVIPNHLQVQTADCSHLSFGSFGNTMNTTFPGSFTSRHKIEETPVAPDTTQSVGPSETRNPEYYGDESLMASENRQAEVMKQENADVAHGNINNNNNNNNNQYSFSSSTPGQGYSFDSTQLLNPSFPQSQTPTQMQTATPFSNIVQQQGGAYTNSLPSTLLAGNNGHLVGDADLSYSPFPISQQTATKYGSISEALKTGVFSSSSSQPTQQTPPGNAIPPALPQHLTVHPYSQPALPLGPFANMIGYPFLPQSYTYMPSGFQQTYHQQLGQLAAVLPQYKNSVSVSSLPQSAAVPSGYGAFGNSGTVPGNYQVNQPAGGSGMSYDDVLNAHYKESSQLLSLQQQNDSSAMWVHGAGSRTMSAVPASTYYSFQGQSQQPAGFRQGQQQQQAAGQTYGGGAAGNYQNYYHSQAGMSPEQNRGDVGGGSQGQPKAQQQSQQLWQNSY